MAITIPELVFTQYEAYVDAMIADFGIPCDLVYTDRVEVANQVLDHVKQRRTFGPTSTPGGFSKGATSYKNVEATESITLRVYWTQRDWKKIGNFDLPDGSIVCIGYLDKFDEINKAKHLITNTDLSSTAKFLFEKAGEPQPWGLKQRRYMVSTWKRI